MPQEIALILMKRNPLLLLNTLQIKWHLKYLESKENKCDKHFDIFSKNNENCSNNVIENISIEHMTSTSTNISSPDQIHEEVHVQFIRQHKKKVTKQNFCQLQMFLVFHFIMKKKKVIIKIFLIYIKN
jgi:hypothetical protein